jgi:hypothetical protein
MTKESAPEPICPICTKPIARGDLVVFGHGDLVHVACHVSAEGADETVVGFLRGSTGRSYCHTCLARAMNLSWRDTAKIVTRLRVTPGFRVTTGQCALCSELRVTISAG